MARGLNKQVARVGRNKEVMKILTEMAHSTDKGISSTVRRPCGKTCRKSFSQARVARAPQSVSPKHGLGVSAVRPRIAHDRLRVRDLARED